MKKPVFIYCVLCGLMFCGCSREAARREVCADNLRQIWLALNAYTEDYHGKFPPIDDRRGNLIMDGDTIFPTYVENLDVFRCPSNKAHEPLEAPYTADDVADHSYFYLGWTVSTEEEGSVLLDVYESLDLAERDRDIWLSEGRGSGRGQTIYRLREGIERFFITDVMNPAAAVMAASTIPVVCDRPANHGGRAGNVLYMDGHVEFVPYPGEFPMTTRFMKRLEEISSNRDTN